MASLLALREAAARWMISRGIRQWQPGEVGPDDVRDQVEAGQWHVLREAGTPVAALRLLWQDDDTWGPQPPVAGYVHGLVVDRRYAGVGLGSRLLDWAADQVLLHGRTVLRLDCSEQNPVLRRYYSAHGFREVGRHDRDGRSYSVVLFEKQISDASAEDRGSLG